MADPERRISTGRMEALSEGVFAIAMTLLVLDIAIPSPSGDLLNDFVRQWPSYLAYVISFATIGGVWLAHSVITEYLSVANPTLIRLNLLLLMVVSFLPFPTRLLADHVREEQQERVAATIYGLTLLATVLLVAVMWQYARRHGLLHTSATNEDIRVLTRRLTPGLGAYLVMLVLGLFFPIVAVFGYLAIAVSLVLPLRHRRVRRYQPPATSRADRSRGQE